MNKQACQRLPCLLKRALGVAQPQGVIIASGPMSLGFIIPARPTKSITTSTDIMHYACCAQELDCWQSQPPTWRASFADQDSDMLPRFKASSTHSNLRSTWLSGFWHCLRPSSSRPSRLQTGWPSKQSHLSAHQHQQRYRGDSKPPFLCADLVGAKPFRPASVVSTALWQLQLLLLLQKGVSQALCSHVDQLEAHCWVPADERRRLLVRCAAKAPRILEEIPLLSCSRFPADTTRPVCWCRCL